MERNQLGEFEEVVMLTVGILFGDAYGVTIKKEIEQRLSRSVSVGALQTALKRLEQKGYLDAKEGESTKERAGRPKKFFTITAQGKNVLQQTHESRNEMWNAIPSMALDLKMVLA